MKRHGRLFFGLLLFALAAAFAAESGEKSARFRFGTVLSAEVSTAKPEILDQDKGEPPPSFPDFAWAELVVKLDKGRSLSVYDFSLVSANGRNEYKCYAIAEEDRPYSLRDWQFEKTNMFVPYRLLFPVQLPPLNRAPDYDLKFKLFPSPLPDLQLRFRDMGDRSFTESSKVPRQGLLGVSLKELRPEKPKAEEAPAAAPKPEAKDEKKDSKPEPKKDDKKDSKAEAKKDEKKDSKPEPKKDDKAKDQKKK